MIVRRQALQKDCFRKLQLSEASLKSQQQQEVIEKVGGDGFHLQYLN